ncbi:MAG: 30S ribosomal protein S12 methylthiotransferase RimO [Phycisphaerae bacterium]|nr:30S ribosomal protein S12 methylthiotransferase RimO [Phycisphaerae bacterium]
MSKPTVSLVSLGCPKNLVDSEKMLGLLAESGCAIASEAVGADVLVVNTCGFLATSRDEALGILRDAAARKRRGEIRRLVVAGCLVQRDGQRLVEEVPEIDALVGVNNREDIVRAVAPGSRRSARANGNRRPGEPLVFLAEYHPLRSKEWTDRARVRLTPPHYAYVRISEGCDQKCTFCTIPSIRGPMHCKPVERILDECREMIDDGVRELILIGQDTTSYGRDIGYAPGLAGLLRELDRLDGATWIRLMYVYPTEVDEALIDAIAECTRVVKYVDIPLQHINDRVLKAMHRRIDRAGTESLLRRLRDRIRGVSLRTTFIAGFPGETDAEFAELVEFVREQRFDAVGVFPYSLEPETPSGRMRHQLPQKVKQSRVAALMEAQQPIAFEKARAMAGRRFDVVIDAFGRDGVYPGRHAGQAPEIDSVTYVRGGEFDVGQLVRVRGTGSDGYDVLAVPNTTGLSVLQ